VQILPASSGVAVDNKANGVGGVAGIYVISDAAGVGAGDASSVALGAGKASLVLKTNSSIAARVVCVSWCSCQRSHAERGESQIIPQFTNAENFKQN
jgi:hypothetical protein